MCGITGIVDLREKRPINQGLIRDMNDSLSHRGPDGDGFHFEPGVGFGHRRLSIIDLSPAGHQPMLSETGKAILPAKPLIDTRLCSRSGVLPA